MADKKQENLGEATLGLNINSEKFDKKMKEVEASFKKFNNITRDKVQDFRDMVRPILTIMLAASYLIVVNIACWKGGLTGKEAVAAIGTPFMMIMTYHFTKAALKDSNKG